MYVLHQYFSNFIDVTVQQNVIETQQRTKVPSYRVSQES